MDKVLQRHTALPEVSGGYMLKIDRLDPGDSGFTGGSQALAFVEPKESEVTSAQRSFLVNYLNNMNRSLRNRDYTAATPAYDSYVDEAAWIDFHILNEFTKNPDGFRLSTYMYLPRDGRLTFGPVWDFDRTMGCDDDNRAANPADGPECIAMVGGANFSAIPISNKLTLIGGSLSEKGSSRPKTSTPSSIGWLKS